MADDTPPNPNPFASPPSTPAASTLSFATASGSAPAPAPAPSPPTRTHFPRSSTSISLRETFSAPPPFARRTSFSLSGTSTPGTSRPSTAASSALGLTAHPHTHSISALGPVPLPLPDDVAVEKEPPAPILKSYMLTGEVHKPWLRTRDPRVRASWWITFCTTLLGVAASAAVCYLGFRDIELITQPLCLVLQDDFDTFNVDTPGATWRHEVDLSGFGNGQFEMTTPAPSNSFVRDGMLYLVPTLTALALPGGNASVFDGAVYNATGCTGHDEKGRACGAVSNATSGTIINPVQSARITTQLSKSIQYGKVEIRARTPKGDWLWPALWMLPVNETYGPWPLSGEIDIMESRGNDQFYPAQGNNYVRSALNWGPSIALNAVAKTYGWWTERRSNYAREFHTYTLEWTQDFIRIFVDTRLHHMLDLRLNQPFFARGQFPPTVQNASQIVALQDPWIGRGNAAPFDQPFFLIMNVAVGGTNGWFPDNAGGKPWVDGSATAMRDFALAQDKWYPTWPENVEDRALVVDYVKMWQLC